MKVHKSILLGLLLIGLILPLESFAAALTDIAASPNRTAIQYLFDNNVISGYSDGTFKPYNTVNRAELLKILVGGTGNNPSVAQYHSCFPDVNSEWFAPYVCYAKSKGWVQGYPDNSFRPSQVVSKVEAIKMLVNSQSYTVPQTVTETLFSDVQNTQWYAPFVQVAKSKGLLELSNGSYGVTNGMTRGEISENIYRAMIIQKNGLSSFTTNVQNSSTQQTVAPAKEVYSQTDKIAFDGFEWQILNVYKMDRIGSSSNLQFPKNKYFIVVEAQLRNTTSSPKYHGDSVVLVGDKQFDDSTVVAVYGKYFFNYESFDAIQLEGGAQSKTFFGFDVAETSGQNITLILKPWVPVPGTDERAKINLTNIQDKTSTASNTATESTSHVFYVSSEAKTLYYCDTDTAWQSLARSNLLTFTSEAALLKAMPGLTLHEPCK